MGVSIRYKQFVVVGGLVFAYLLMSSLFLGSWSGSDYQAYNNAVICRSGKSELCIRTDTPYLVMSKLEISDNASVFTQRSSNTYQKQVFIENLPSSPFLNALSMATSKNTVQTIFHLHLLLALLVTVLIALAVWTTTAANRRNIFAALFLILSIPAFSSVASTVYPVVISTFAMIVAMIAVRRILNTTVSPSLLAVYSLELVLATILVLMTRYETSAVLLLDFLLVIARTIASKKKVNLRVVFVSVLVCLVSMGVFTNPYFKNLNVQIAEGRFSTRSIPTQSEKLSTNGVGVQLENESFVLRNGRIGSIIAAPSIYVTELVVLPWISKPLLLKLAVTVLVMLMVLLVMMGYRFGELKFVDYGSALVKLGSLILIPGVSSYGSIRLLYALPFFVSLLIELLAGGYFLRQRIVSLTCLNACIFVLSMTLFVLQNKFIDFYYFGFDSMFLIPAVVVFAVISIGVAIQYSPNFDIGIDRSSFSRENVV